MAGGKAQFFLDAKKVLRAHPDWTDEQVAERIGIPKVLVEEIIPVARRDLVADHGEVVDRQTQVGEKPYPHTYAQDVLDAGAARDRQEGG